MVSYNIACKNKKPGLYENVDIIRLNSPWYSKEELNKILKDIKKPKFIDINIKKRTKPKKTDHNFEELLKIVGKYQVEWVGISNIEETKTYDKVRKLLGNNSTKICAKIETQKGCDLKEEIINKYDGIMVDTEDLAFQIGWDKAIEEKEKIYDSCNKKHKEHFRLSGVIFEHIKPKIVVYTYGAFDLLHPGHIKMLETAASFGDELIVGIVGDKAIRDLKGKDRPIQNEKDRLRTVQSLKCVDVAMMQKDYDPEPNLEKIKPDILVKGDDWDHIPGQEWMKKHGGKLIKPPYSGGWSTSATVKKIMEQK